MKNNVQDLPEITEMRSVFWSFFFFFFGTVARIALGGPVLSHSFLKKLMLSFMSEDREGYVFERFVSKSPPYSLLH